MLRLIGNAAPWRPVTAGERLLFLLLSRQQEWGILRDRLEEAPRLELCNRFTNFSEFFVGSLALNVHQRLVRLARHVRDLEENRDVQARRIRERMVQDLGVMPLSFTGDLGELADTALTCAEVAERDQISGALQGEVVRQAPAYCYSCGLAFEGDRHLTCDHLWPASLGGDTIAANLLPACQFCNQAKHHSAVWQMSWLQPAVYAPAFDLIPREVKMGLHLRAAMQYAAENGATLKDAFLAIGPREDPAQIDPGDGFDFFNMRVHDEERTSVRWLPQ